MRQVHLGYYLTELDAARAYDRAAINKSAHEPSAKGQFAINCPISDYEEDLEILLAFPLALISKGVGQDE